MIFKNTDILQLKKIQIEYDIKVYIFRYKFKRCIDYDL